MTPLRRLLPATAAALALSLSLAACGGGDDEKDAADEASASSSASTSAAASPSTNSNAGKAEGTPEFCAQVEAVIATMTNLAGQLPDEGEWKKIQDSYAGLAKVDLPADATADQKKGAAIITKAITGLSYADAQKAFQDQSAGNTIPGVSAADTKLAEDFLVYANTTCTAAAANQ